MVLLFRSQTYAICVGLIPTVYLRKSCIQGVLLQQRSGVHVSLEQVPSFSLALLLTSVLMIVPCWHVASNSR